MDLCSCCMRIKIPGFLTLYPQETHQWCRIISYRIIFFSSIFSLKVDFFHPGFHQHRYDKCSLSLSEHRRRIITKKLKCETYFYLFIGVSFLVVALFQTLRLANYCTLRLLFPCSSRSSPSTWCLPTVSHSSSSSSTRTSCPTSVPKTGGILFLFVTKSSALLVSLPFKRRAGKCGEIA